MGNESAQWDNGQQGQQKHQRIRTSMATMHDQNNGNENA